MALTLCLALYGAKGNPGPLGIVLLSSGIAACLFYAFSGWAWRRALSPAEKIGRTLILIVATCGSAALYGWQFWPRPEVPKFTIRGYEIPPFIPKKPIFANVFFENVIGSPVDATVYGNGGIAPATEDEVKRKEFVTELKATVDKTLGEGGGLTFTIMPYEQRWFTVFGPAFSVDDTAKITRGEFDFYFTGTLVGKNGSITSNTPFCGFVRGDKTNVVFGCPKP